MAYIVTPEEKLLLDGIAACCGPEAKRLLVQLANAASRSRREDVVAAWGHMYSSRLKKAVHETVIKLEASRRATGVELREDLTELVAAFREEER